MKFADHLNKEQIQKFNQLRKTPKRKNHSNNDKRNKEKFTDRDLAELMGTNRDTYRRVRGAIRRN